jgi:predicted dinucleotide-binding enzyme
VRTFGDYGVRNADEKRRELDVRYRTLAQRMTEQGTMTTAIIGIGNTGGTLARELAAGGEPVVLSAGSADNVRKLAAEIGTPATAALNNRGAVRGADTVILALWLGPMHAVIDEVADLLPG